MVEALATADDHVEADGDRVLDWAQAQVAVRALGGAAERRRPADRRDRDRRVSGRPAREPGRARRDRCGQRGLPKHVPAALLARWVAELTVHELRRSAQRHGLNERP